LKLITSTKSTRILFLDCLENGAPEKKAIGPCFTEDIPGSAVPLELHIWSCSAPQNDGTGTPRWRHTVGKNLQCKCVFICVYEKVLKIQHLMVSSLTP